MGCDAFASVAPGSRNIARAGANVCNGLRGSHHQFVTTRGRLNVAIASRPIAMNDDRR
jgi:hypothetical protein